MKRSIKKKVAFTFTLLLLFSLLAIGFFQFFFMGDFYLAEKQKILEQSWKKVSSMSASEGFDELKRYSTVNNLEFCLADSNLSVIVSNTNDVQNITGTLFGNILDKEKENTRTIKKTEQYQIIEIHDRFTDVEYLELWGMLDNGNYFIVNTPLQSISDSVDISLRFYAYIGVVALVIGFVVIWLMTKRIVRPVQELSCLSKRMADLDFDAKYTSGGEDEIGELGRNFNVMANELQKAVSELKSANAQLQKDIAEKTRIDDMRKEFLSNVSHELKTPIALIQGYAEGLKDNINEDPENRDFYCEVIMDEAGKMNRMVKQLMALNELEFGRDRVVMERFDLTELIRGILHASQIMIEQKNATVLFDDSKAVYVWGDEFKIEQVVTNYLTNALNHLDNERKIEIRCTEKDGIVTTTVFNSGKPIPEDELDKIWLKFYKVDKARTRAYGGSGVGLSIVKAIMDGHQQKCWATNYDNGVAFSFTLESKV